MLNNRTLSQSGSVSYFKEKRNYNSVFSILVRLILQIREFCFDKSRDVI